jgi:hypothetical protein
MCTAIGKAIVDPSDDGNEIEVGTFGELQQNAESCPTCRSFLSGCSRDKTEILEPDALIIMYRKPFPDSDLQICDEGHNSLYSEVAELQPHKPSRSAGIIVDEKWIDLQRVRAWLNFCDDSHQNTCHGFPDQEGVRAADNLLLIDVDEERLVSAPGTAQYYTLSYVWGKDTGEAVLETTKENIEAHRKRGFLSLERHDLRLPETIKDSMRLVKRLNGRYLWVDRLCIIQNSVEHKSQQIGMMGSIYAQSYCTIIAAGGNDSHYGLRGVGGGSKPRQFYQRVLQFPGASCVLLNDSLDAERLSFWNTRGWTYQEKIMSRRALVFAKNTVTWRCQHNIWREDLTGDPEGVERPRPHMGSFDLFVPYPWPNLFQWMFVIQKYNRRNLSFESDRLAAVAGIESALSASFVGGFYYGLPRLFFDIALLWQPNSPMKRRFGDSENIQGYLPSWSWMGWHGALRTISAFVGFDYLRTNPQDEDSQQTSCITTPLVEWRVTNLTGKQERISNSYHTWRDMAALPIEKLPEGWTKHQPNVSDKPYFSHDRAGPATFWWPVPMDSDPTKSRPQAASPYLTFRTSRAYFTIAQRTRSLDLCQCMSVIIKDMEGNWAGVLRLNIPKSAPVPTGQTVELVAISAGQADNLRDESWLLEEWDLNQRPRLGPLYEFYNVMHVRREDGWISRESLGRVEKGVWERQQLEECEFKMR